MLSAGQHWIADIRTLNRAFGNVRASLRLGGSSKAGPVVTDQGNFILDATGFDEGESFCKANNDPIFDAIVVSELLRCPSLLGSELKQITGVVETGLFYGLVDEAYFGYIVGRCPCEFTSVAYSHAPVDRTVTHGAGVAIVLTGKISHCNPFYVLDCE